MAEAGHDHVYLALRLRTAPATRSRSSSLDASAWMALAPMSCTASSSASGPPMSVEVIRARFDLSRVRPTDVHVQFNPSHVLSAAQNPGGRLRTLDRAADAGRRRARFGSCAAQ